MLKSRKRALEEIDEEIVLDDSGKLRLVRKGQAAPSRAEALEEMKTADPPWMLHLRLMEERLEKRIEERMGKIRKLEPAETKLHNEPPGTMNRMTALVGVLEQALSFLSFKVRRAVARDGRPARLVGRSGGQPFSQMDNYAVDYKTLWWFVLDFEARDRSLREWWHDVNLDQSGRVPHNWDTKRRSSSRSETYRLARDVLGEAELEFFGEVGCGDNDDTQKSLRALLGYMLSYLKPMSLGNESVGVMAIVSPECGESSSRFSRSVHDVKLRIVSREDLATQIRVFFDLRRNACGLIDKRFHGGLEAVLKWYETKLSRMTSQFTVCSDEEEGIYYFIDGRWFLDEQDRTADYLELFAARW